MAVRSGDAVSATPPNNVSYTTSSFPTLKNGDRFDFDSAQNLVGRQSIEQGVAGPFVALTPDASGRNRPGTMGGVSLSYDLNGNLEAKGDLRFEYDFRNRLTRVTNSIGQEVVSYQYDALNRRISKTVSGIRTDIVWSGWQAVEEYEANSLSRRRLFGSGLDEIVYEEADLDLDGTLETGYYPIYDSTRNLVTLTRHDGVAFERYEYEPFGGDQTIQVDALPPSIRQFLAGDDQIRFDLSEEVIFDELLKAIDDERLRLEDENGEIVPWVPEIPEIPSPWSGLRTGEITPAAEASTVGAAPEAATGAGLLTTTLDYRSSQEVRRVYLTLDTPPAPGTELRLIVAADALRDPFGNTATTATDLTFTWPASETVISDTTPPAIHAVRLRQGYLEIELDEEPDLATVQTAITVTPVVSSTMSPGDGDVTSTAAAASSALGLGWELLPDGFTVRSDQPLAPGTFNLQIDASLQDLAGFPLPDFYQQQFEAAVEAADLELFEAPDPRKIPVSSVGNLFGFQGLPRDPETGLIYVRNRYYDPELGRFITADPLGYVDGPSMYQFALNSPVNFGDPLGLCLEINNIHCFDTLKSLGGYFVGLGESGLDLLVGLPKMVWQDAERFYRYTGDIIEASPKGLGETFEVMKRAGQENNAIMKERMLGLIPFVNTFREGSQIKSRCLGEGAFACGRQIGRTTFSLGMDVAVVHGAAKGVKSVKSATDFSGIVDDAVTGGFESFAREARGSSLRTLNLGSGRNPMSGAINVDRLILREADVIADSRALPFRSRTFNEVVSINPAAAATEFFNPLAGDAARVLRPGGTLTVVGQMRNYALRRVVRMDLSTVRALGFQRLGGPEAAAGRFQFGQPSRIDGRSVYMGNAQQITFKRLP